MCDGVLKVCESCIGPSVLKMAGNGGRGNVMPFAQPDRKPEVHYLLEVISSVLEELVRAGEQERGKTAWSCRS